MSYINIKEVNCKNCYKCLKNCTVKSIKFADNKVSILEDGCILCGRCINVCPQGAKTPANNTARILNWLENKTCRVVASLAPSYVGIYGRENIGQVYAALRALGFDEVQETALGANQVTLAYNRLLKEKAMPSLFTTCCPTVNMLVTKYYPDLIPFLAPVLSPVLAHGQMIKQQYGPETKVFFIGPCLSKFKETQDHPNLVDGALSFQQLDELLETRGLLPGANTAPVPPEGPPQTFSRIYPVPEGIIRDVKLSSLVKFEEESCQGYGCVSVCGLENIRAFFEEFRRGEKTGIFAELNACDGGCMNGPLVPKNRQATFLGRIAVEKHAGETPVTAPARGQNLALAFTADGTTSEIPNEETIRKILSEIGKPTKDKELNCGSCGYSTCRDKAIAVYQKKAELYMCLPFMNDLNQSLSNVTLSVSPNYILVADRGLRIIECNLAAQRRFGFSRKELTAKYLYELMDPADFETVFESRRSIADKRTKFTIQQQEVIALQSLVYVPAQDIIVSFLKDVTQEEHQREELRKARLNAAALAQKVIEKQMVAAQEIASLLGETTAETKVTLNNLQQQILNE
ncbi:MAG: [Fe-Fe] hydrogenase large subunit C-terminal domain-containing protein [Oscillospiraceae bacterium]